MGILNRLDGWITMKQAYLIAIPFIAFVFFIAFLMVGDWFSEGWIKSFDNASIVLGYIWTCLTIAIAVYAFFRRQRIAQWFKKSHFHGTGEELDIIAAKVDAIVIPVSIREQPEWIIRCMKPSIVAFLYTERSRNVALALTEDFKEAAKFILSDEEIKRGEHLIKNPDDPLETKEKAKIFIRRFKAENYQANRIFVDTTGGKVPMSIGAFQAAEEEGVSSIYVVGGYEDAVKGMIIKDPTNCSHGKPIFISNRTE
jgi:hypothetical protein